MFSPICYEEKIYFSIPFLVPNFGSWYHVCRNFNEIVAMLQYFRERWRFQERDFRECLYDDHVRTVGIRTREIISRRSKRVNDLRGGKFLCAASFVPNYSSLGRTQSNTPSGGSFHHRNKRIHCNDSSRDINSFVIFDKNICSASFIYYSLFFLRWRWNWRQMNILYSILSQILMLQWRNISFTKSYRIQNEN